jgi:hypothetical protein
MMTRKDYHLIATIIKNLNVSPDIRRMVIWQFTKTLREFHPNFNSDLFITACEKPND